MAFTPSLRFVVIGAFGATALGLLALGGAALWGEQTLSGALSTSARATDALNRLRTVSAQAEGFAAAPLDADLAALGTASSELRRSVAEIAASASEPTISESLSNSLAALDTLPGLFDHTIATADSTAAQTAALAALVARIDGTLAEASRAAADASVTRFSDLQVSFGPFVKIGGLGEGLAPIASRLGEIEAAIGSDDALLALATASTDAGAATAKRLRFKVDRSQRAVVGKLGGALRDIETALKAIAAGSAPGDVTDTLRNAIATADAARGALVGASLTPITEALGPFGDTLAQASALGGAMLDLGKASSMLAALNVALADFRAAPAPETRDQVLSLAGQIAARVAKAEGESKRQVPEIGAAAAAIGAASAALATPLDALIALTIDAADNQSAIRAAMGEVASSIARTSRTIDANGQDQAILVNRLALAAFAISVVTLIGAALLVTFRILKPVQTVARRMERLAAGDTEVAAEETTRSDEIGDMLRAFRVFRDNAVERRVLREAEAAREAASRAERAALMQQLQQEFGAVVAAGVGGDFSRRIEVRFEDPELAGLADGVNALVASVDAGVAEASRVMGLLAEGDLTIAMTGRFEGAFAELQADVNNTVASLSSLIAEIRGESQGIEQSIASIAQGADALSQRTDEQARSLAETSTAMDAMSQTIEQTSANAHRAATMADEASERADASGAVLNETVDAMGRIEAGAQQISDIVSVIDGIAFQTNLLALNAAVEAARAGEAGKGFAIVAQEVRSLAQRAGASAHDIRALIEQSATQVSDGVRLVGETRQTIEAMVTAMKEGAVLVSEINRASLAEKASLDEVAGATSELEQTTQQNHQQAGASARAAHGVTEATARLREMLDRFRVDEACAESRVA